MHDRHGDGRSFRTFNVLDDYNREGLSIEGGFLITGTASYLNIGADHRMVWQAAGDSVR